MENKDRRTSTRKSTQPGTKRTQERTERTRSTGEARKRPRQTEGQRPRRAEEQRPRRAEEQRPRRAEEQRPRRKRSAELDDDFTLLLSDDVKSIRSSSNASNRTSQAKPRRNTSASNDVRNQRPTNSRRRGKVTKEQRSNAKSKRIGLILAGLQVIASLIFTVAIIQLNMLPTRYLVALLVLLILLCVLLFLGQLFSKKNAIAGKIFSTLLTIVLITGSFYIFKAYGTLSDITGGDVKVDHIVVAVMDSDPAESIEDVAEYSIGVQYAMDGEDIEEAVVGIEEKLGTTLDVTEYSDMQALAVALQTGEVQAIIYNEAHSSFIEDENPDFATDIRVIYTYEIETELSLEMKAVESIEVKDDNFIVYISGIDVYGSITKNSRSDVNILAVVNPTTHNILLVTTPRDYYVSFPGVTGDSKDKLTHAGIYGVDTSMATLESIYDVDIDFYARVNFTSLIEMVDALGGISVYSEYSFTTIQHAGLYKLKVDKGYNDFDGTDALIFSRERYNVPGGDNTRGQNQQSVIKAMIEKACSPAIITSAYGLMESVSGNVDTNMTNAQIQDLIKQQIDENIDWNIESISVTGEGSSQYCYSYSGGALYVTIPDYDSVDLAIAQINAVLDGGTIDDVVVDEDTEE